VKGQISLFGGEGRWNWTAQCNV